MNSIIFALLALFALLFVRFISLEWIGYSRIRKFRQQGLKRCEYVFWPYSLWLDLYYYFFPGPPGDDHFGGVKRFMSKSEKNEPFVVAAEGGKCWFNLLSPEAIAEFYKKEIAHTMKMNYFVKLKFLAFFFQNGKEVHEGRATFSKIFHYSNVIRLMPQVHQSVKNHVKALRKRVAEAKDQRLKMNIKEDFLLDLFEDLTGCLLLTGAEKKIRATFDGMSISKVLKKMFDCFEAHPHQLIAWLPFCEELGLSSYANEFKRLQSGFRKIIADQYKQRYNSANEEDLTENSILDIMVKLNKKSEKETGKPQFTLEEISNNFEIFQFAGSDTSFQVSCSLMTYLAQPENQEFQERLSKEVRTELDSDEDLDNDKLSSLKELDMCFMETMRLANPAFMIFPRKVVKDFKICGHQLKKGDIIRQYLVHYQPTHFKDPYKFIPDRFTEEARKKLPKTMQIPFSHGQRACVGKYLGEMIVKLIISEIYKNFKIEVEEGYHMKMGLNPIYGVANPDLILSLRED